MADTVSRALWSSVLESGSLLWSSVSLAFGSLPAQRCWNSDSQADGGPHYRTVTARLFVDHTTEQ